MAVYMVERNVRGFAPQALASVEAAVVTKAAEMTASGREIRYLRSTLIPQDGRCLSFYESGEAGIVWLLNEQMGLPFEKISEVYDLGPSALLKQ
ncbi:MAG: nickel-binding protein [Dongiaceae bacterium]